MEEDKFGVALTKEVCPICLKEQDGAICFNSRLTVSAANKIKELHGKVVGFAKKPCKECLEKYKGRVVFISIDVSQSDPETPDNPYRTGGMAAIRNRVVKDLVPREMYIRMLKHKMTYIDHREFALVVENLTKQIKENENN